MSYFKRLENKSLMFCCCFISQLFCSRLIFSVRPTSPVWLITIRIDTCSVMSIVSLGQRENDKGTLGILGFTML